MDPKTSLWIRVNGHVSLGNETRCCFPRIQTSQDKEETSILENKWGNKYFIELKFGGPIENATTYNHDQKC